MAVGQAISPSTPIRTCIATRKRYPRTKLVRIALKDACSNVLVADPSACMPGRGAWITPTLESYELAEVRGVFARAFRIRGEVDTRQLRAYFESDVGWRTG